LNPTGQKRTRRCTNIECGLGSGRLKSFRAS
jgi:hypothetical protein